MLWVYSIQKVLTSSKEEVDVLVKNYQSTSQLASFLVVLRRDYDALKASKSAVKKEKDRLSQEITYLKRKVLFAATEGAAIHRFVRTHHV